MKLSRSNQVVLSISAGIVSLCAGTLLSSNFKNAGQTITLATLLSLPTVAGLHLVLDGKATRRINEAEAKANNAESRASQAEFKAIEATATLSQTQSRLTELSKKNSELASELSSVRASLEDVSLHRHQLIVYAERVQPTINQLQQELRTAQETVEGLQAEIEELETDFEEKVEAEAEARFQEAKREEIQRIFDEHDAITSKAMTLFKRLQTWGQKVAVSHEQKRELITSLASAYNQNLDELGQSVETERGHYLEQIELLHEKVGRLQHQLNGDLLEPEVNNAFGFAIEGRIANELAKLIFSDLQIPLAVKGFNVKPDGSTDVGYGYSRSIPPEAVVEGLKRHSEHLARRLGIHKITAIRKLEVGDLIVLTFRQQPAVKASDIGLYVGSAEEFVNYITSHPVRFRLIADPGMGKTPTAAVMLSEILKAGTRRGNTAKGAKVAHTLVTVSYPGVNSSLKDSDYPLDLFLKYGTETAAIKSFQDAIDDWEYRKQNVAYAEQFFQIWCWDEFDNTVNSASDPQALANSLKTLLKQGGHNNVGWILSGQSVMTKQIPGFTNDDRSLFTEIIIGIPKIRHYLNTYGKGKNSESNLAKLSRNLDEIEEYIDHKNELITDDARLLRVALVVDSRSPKLYFLPNLDTVRFNTEAVEETRELARQFKEGQAGKVFSRTSPSACSNPVTVNVSSVPSQPEKSPIGVQEALPHCPECGSANVKPQSQNRYKCTDCGVRRVEGKMVWK
jgi:ribosomal protein S27AE/peptidoglycan hydrolase CwlO-like protein